MFVLNGVCAVCGADDDSFDGLCWDCYDMHWKVVRLLKKYMTKVIGFVPVLVVLVGTFSQANAPQCLKWKKELYKIEKKIIKAETVEKKGMLEDS